MLREHNELTLDTIFKISHDLRNNGKTVAFTHGAFDLFHYGHLYLLRRTASKCDYLIVGVESDANVAKYKSYKRPIIPEERRREIIAELDCVDVAFINRGDIEKDILEKLYKYISPSFVSYGRLFSFEDDVKRRTSEFGIGLEVFAEDHSSTSRIIRDIVKRYAEEQERVQLRPRDIVRLVGEQEGNTT